ncbi:hypothetical protein ZPR_2170 [Zunongwangia profunda SM-A87]|uniref:Uncharacterized protein n=1 Tax=Zunongwangia profunda (strain DSM 18752 / CCTCC AB 206139 / SM-A87) TaxID=655815 RepID=D5BAY2_ZUNPS|nr:hypothetical protein ZPR_2170 [Zunongwangia profunda SM-A87]
MHQILSISLTDKTNLKELFSKTKFQYDKELINRNWQSLLNFKNLPILMK